MDIIQKEIKSDLNSSFSLFDHEQPTRRPFLNSFYPTFNGHKYLLKVGT